MYVKHSIYQMCSTRDPKVQQVKRESSPCPNFMQIRSSTMHMATESQQKAPTFFTGFLR
jgi:hypothetical protein